MDYLFTSWPRILQDLRNARHVMLLSDFDGTLTPIVERPEMALISPDLGKLMQSLAKNRHLSIGVISGRALADLKTRVGIEGIVYAGNHGLEIEGPSLSFISPLAQEIKPILRVIGYVLNQALSPIKGVIVENKGLSLSIHYRMVDSRHTGDVENVVKKIVGPAEISGKARLTTGKKVYEVRPAIDWDKGKAVRLLMKRYGRGGWKSGLVPIYIGDDRTDEDAFKVIETYGYGISVFVGERNSKSHARYYLRSPDEVSIFLQKLAGAAHEFCSSNGIIEESDIRPVEI